MISYTHTPNQMSQNRHKRPQTPPWGPMGTQEGLVLHENTPFFDFPTIPLFHCSTIPPPLFLHPTIKIKINSNKPKTFKDVAKFVRLAWFRLFHSPAVQSAFGGLDCGLHSFYLHLDISPAYRSAVCSPLAVLT